MSPKSPAASRPSKSPSPKAPAQEYFAVWVVGHSNGTICASEKDAYEVLDWAVNVLGRKARLMKLTLVDVKAVEPRRKAP